MTEWTWGEIMQLASLVYLGPLWYFYTEIGKNKDELAKKGEADDVSALQVRVGGLGEKQISTQGHLDAVDNRMARKTEVESLQRDIGKIEARLERMEDKQDKILDRVSMVRGARNEQ